jgi:hypothetical protein
MSNKRAVETLGMSHGAACNRLRKMVLFRQLEKHSDNICVRCNKEIESIDELSIEHIKPWEGRSAELFWDLSNVGFSHMACNLADRATRQKEVGEKLRRPVPDGTAWCFRCKSVKAKEDFGLDASRWNGLNKECKPCKDERNALRDRRQI